MIEPHKAVVIPKDRRRPEPTMSIPRSVADVIRNHVTLEVEGIDRMYLNVYQPKRTKEKKQPASFASPRQQPLHPRRLDRHPTRFCPVDSSLNSTVPVVLS
jgi:hypothetical protein